MVPQQILTRATRTALGVFVCLQLVYLPLANFLQRVPRRPDPLPDEILGRHQREGRCTANDTLQHVVDGAGIACDRWAEATAQNQGWSLFAPRFGEAGTFLTLTTIDEDGHLAELRSAFEPADVDDYVRFDVVNYRLFYREMSFALVYATWTPEAFSKQGIEWRVAVREHVLAVRRSLAAYVRWRTASEFPDRHLREVAIGVRVFLPPDRSGAAPRPAPVLVPLARWTSARPNHLAIFDPVRGAYAD